MANSEKLVNYLLWLKERGQKYAETCVQPSPSANQAKILFVKDLLRDDEIWYELFDRLKQALKVPKQDLFEIELTQLINTCTKHRHAVIVLLGANSWPANYGKYPGLNVWTEIAEHKAVVISHPREMLQNPQLKVAAWDTLKKVLAKCKG